MSQILDTSIIIPYLGNVAYDRLVVGRSARDQIYVSSVGGMELLAGSLRDDRRRRADAFLGRLQLAGRLMTATEDEWLRGGRILARYQNLFGHVCPGAHIGDILILLAAERIGAEVITENGEQSRIWSRFRPVGRRPRLVVLRRRDYLNHG